MPSAKVENEKIAEVLAAKLGNVRVLIRDNVLYQLLLPCLFSAGHSWWSFIFTRRVECLVLFSHD